MGKRRKLEMTVILILMLSVILSACTGNNENGNANENQGTDDNAKIGNEVTLPEKFDPPVTITQMGCINDTFKFREGESLNDNVHTRWVSENLGIKLSYISETAADQCDTKLRLALASGEPLPDIMKTFDDTLADDLLESGRLLDITESFDRYASEQVKEIFGLDPSYWYKVSKDGKKYGLPILESANQNNPIMWIREDWLNTLELKAPTTFDEMEVVMDAFVKANLGKAQKPVGMAVALKGTYATWMSDASVIFGGFGIIPGYWNKWNGEELTYGSVQPQTKEALALMQDWFKKGYISPDAGLSDESKASELFTSEQAGIIFGPRWMAGWPLNSVLKANNPEAEFNAYPLPSGPSGAPGPHDSVIANGRLLISKDFKHMDALMLYINKLYEIGDPAEGSEFEHGYAENYDYVLIDGKPRWDNESVPGGIINVFKYFPAAQTATDPYLEFNNYTKIFNNETLTKPSEKKLKLILDESPTGALQLRAVEALEIQKEHNIPNMFVGSPTPTLKDNGEAMNKLESETFIKIIYGDAPIDEFDKFVDKWNELGGDKATQEVNEWYKSVGGQ